MGVAACRTSGYLILAMALLAGCSPGPGSAAGRQVTVTNGGAQVVPNLGVGGRYPDGIPRTFENRPVLRGQATLDRARNAPGSQPFLVGGWLTYVPGVYSCPAIQPGQEWLAPCGGLEFSDVAGDAAHSLVAAGLLTFHPVAAAQPLGAAAIHSGAAILQVHVHDPRAAVQCGEYVKACDAAMVVERVLWNGDAATAPHPISEAAVAAALARVQPGAQLAPLVSGSVSSDCGGESMPASLHFIVPVPVRSGAAVTWIAIAPSSDALARAFPVPAGIAGAESAAAVESTGSAGGPDGSRRWACRWLRVDNVGVLVRTASARLGSADVAFLASLVAALVEDARP
jgi:hypothetical protein